MVLALGLEHSRQATAAQSAVTNMQPLQVLVPGLHQRLLARQNIHGELLVILGIQVIHLVQHGDVLHQGDLRGPQGPRGPVPDPGEHH